MARTPKLNKPISRPIQADPAPDPVRLPDFNLLDEAAKTKLRAEAAEKFRQREIARAEDAFLKEELERLDRESHPEIHEEEIEVDTGGLAVYCDRLVIDGQTYWADHVYKVKKSLGDVILDQMSRTRRHQAEVQSGDNYTTTYNRIRAAMRTQRIVGRGNAASHQVF